MRILLLKLCLPYEARKALMWLLSYARTGSESDLILAIEWARRVK
jgi:hypothetical protein